MNKSLTTYKLELYDQHGQLSLDIKGTGDEISEYIRLFRNEFENGQVILWEQCKEWECISSESDITQSLFLYLSRKAINQLCCSDLSLPMRRSLLSILLTDISTTAGMCYGFGNIKRSTLKYLYTNLHLEKPLAKFLYAFRNHLRMYSTIPEPIVLVSAPSYKIFRLSKDLIYLNVYALAHSYLNSLEPLSVQELGAIPSSVISEEIIDEVKKWLSNTNP